MPSRISSLIASPVAGALSMPHTLWPVAPDRTINICEWHFHPAELARPGFDASDAVVSGT